MAIYSVIVPSYNQDKFIRETLNNLSELKVEAEKRKIEIQIILVDNCSDIATQSIINEFKNSIDVLVIEKDKGQYDAINKGLRLVKGEYWTWLNTDDLIDIKGFFHVCDYLNIHPETDYVYGNVTYIDEKSNPYKTYETKDLSFDTLLNIDASICQPGSFLKTTFTNKIGELASFHFAFDYEFILRCLKNKAVIKRLDTNLSFFRYYNTSKSGSQDYRFLKEQLAISKQYGGKFFSKLSLLLRLRIVKRKFLK